MSSLPPAGWYPDPVVPGAQRYFDGAAWTAHFVPPPPPPAPAGFPGAYASPWGAPPRQWKGAAYGLPEHGPGSLATPGRRLGARLLDALLLVPIAIALMVAFAHVVGPHTTLLPLKHTATATATAKAFVSGVMRWELVVVGALLATGVVMVVYETVLTAKWGRTLGKRWVGIRPLRTDGTVLGWGRSFGRIALYWLSGFLSWIGLLDPLWCLWDANRQCLHDKAVDTVVVHDLLSPRPPARDLRASPTAIPPAHW
jgi:uncharacterized RDD family membrane protein YckC